MKKNTNNAGLDHTAIPHIKIVITEIPLKQRKFIFSLKILFLFYRLAIKLSVTVKEGFCVPKGLIFFCGGSEIDSKQSLPLKPI